MSRQQSYSWNWYMDASEAGLIARKANVKQLVLSHLPHDGDFNLMKAQAECSFQNPVITGLEETEFLYNSKMNEVE